MEHHNNQQTTNNEQIEKLNDEIDNLKNVCTEYKKNKMRNNQLILTVIACIILYCQHYVVVNQIDVGLSSALITCIGIAGILSIILGWSSYFIEFHIANEKIFKICQAAIWIIEIIAIVIFIVLLL